MMKIIVPKVKFVMWMIISIFLLCSTMLFFSPFFLSDWKVWLPAVVLFSFAITLLWAIDGSHLTIKYNNYKLELTGYFGIRRLKIDSTEVKGYQIKQKVDKYNGAHDEVQLVTHNGKEIIFPAIAYSNYSEIVSFCELEFKFLGHEPVKYAAVAVKLLSVMGLVSGMLAILVALRKFL